MRERIFFCARSPISCDLKTLSAMTKAEGRGAIRVQTLLSLHIHWLKHCGGAIQANQATWAAQTKRENNWKLCTGKWREKQLHTFQRFTFQVPIVDAPE